MIIKTRCNGCEIKSTSNGKYIVSKSGTMLGLYSKLDNAVQFAKCYKGQPVTIQEYLRGKTAWKI